MWDHHVMMMWMILAPSAKMEVYVDLISDHTFANVRLISWAKTVKKVKIECQSVIFISLICYLLNLRDFCNNDAFSFRYEKCFRQNSCSIWRFNIPSLQEQEKYHVSKMTSICFINWTRINDIIVIFKMNKLTIIKMRIEYLILNWG